MFKCIIDAVMDVQKEVPTREIKCSLQTKDLKEVPSPYGIAQPPQCPVKLDIAILKQLNGNHTVIKIINLGGKVKVGRARVLCYGKAHIVDWKGDVKSIKKCLHFIFERLGGFQCRQRTFRSVEEGKPDKEASEEEWDVGFDFIEEQGPRDHTRNRQLRWVTVQTSTTDSPIYGWPQVLVEKSLRNLSQESVLAQVHERWPLTLFDLDVRLLRALAPLFSSLSESQRANALLSCVTSYF